MLNEGERCKLVSEPPLPSKLGKKGLIISKLN